MTHWIAQPFAALVLTAAEAFAAGSPTVPLATFQTERQAADNCPNGIVVWVDPASRMYYDRGRDRYGSTKGGAFACLDAAKHAGSVRRLAAAECEQAVTRFGSRRVKYPNSGSQRLRQHRD